MYGSSYVDKNLLIIATIQKESESEPQLKQVLLTLYVDRIYPQNPYTQYYRTTTWDWMNAEIQKYADIRFMFNAYSWKEFTFTKGEDEHVKNGQVHMNLHYIAFVRI